MPSSLSKVTAGGGFVWIWTGLQGPGEEDGRVGGFEGAAARCVYLRGCRHVYPPVRSEVVGFDGDPAPRRFRPLLVKPAVKLARVRRVHVHVYQVA